MKKLISLLCATILVGVMIFLLVILYGKEIGLQNDFKYVIVSIFCLFIGVELLMIADLIYEEDVKKNNDIEIEQEIAQKEEEEQRVRSLEQRKREIAARIQSQKIVKNKSGKKPNQEHGEVPELHAEEFDIPL